MTEMERDGEEELREALTVGQDALDAASGGSGNARTILHLTRAYMLLLEASQCNNATHWHNISEAISLLADEIMILRGR